MHHLAGKAQTEIRRFRGKSLRLTDLETKCHQDQASRTSTLLGCRDFIPAADNPLNQASDGKPVGLEPEAVR